MLSQSPATTAWQHLANQKLSPVHTVTARRLCTGPRCRHGRGQLRSIRQFCNAKNEPVYRYCELCRGAMKAAKHKLTKPVSATKSI
ncbi:hypothetical protein [Undibacterium sp. TS12]|uniref:hypothetical protein n=1 Tax=Undibacterium sp. TS12 TaxID=2908202 RepID=UPI001F4C7CCC|nr:hypothetical protein [Undibacterium sp. TS12]MCH8622503.1 hypothetical protein [Undibacterium sp. TS12]